MADDDTGVSGKDLSDLCRGLYSSAILNTTLRQRPNRSCTPPQTLVGKPPSRTTQVCLPQARKYPTWELTWVSYTFPLSGGRCNNHPTTLAQACGSWRILRELQAVSHQLDAPKRNNNKVCVHIYIDRYYTFMYVSIYNYLNRHGCGRAEPPLPPMASHHFLTPLPALWNGLGLGPSVLVWNGWVAWFRRF